MSTTFSEANQLRLKLKMKYSLHWWYSSGVVVAIDDGFGVIIMVKQLDNNIRKIISPIVNGIVVKTEVE
jgi:hypothetical protein